jgi:hypothetical protein
MLFLKLTDPEEIIYPLNIYFIDLILYNNGKKLLDSVKMQVKKKHHDLKTLT